LIGGGKKEFIAVAKVASVLLKGDPGMSWTILENITIIISKVLEALFDEIEYRLARLALRHASKNRRVRSRLLIDEVIPT
jgi:hypothetical protein